jgi:exopolysaccharide biosynthesis polyprenyl glycosylphosphotransferase
VVGGYRLDSLRRVGAVVASAIAAVIAGGAAWALAKVLAIKDYILLDDPVGVVGVIGLLILHGAWVLASRAWVRRWCLEREAGARVVVVADRADAEAIAQWHQRGGRANPLSVVLCDGDPSTPVAGAEATVGLDRLAERLDGAVACIVLAASYPALPAAVQSELVHARVGGIPLMTPSAWIEAWWSRTPVRFRDASWLLHEEVLGQSRSVWQVGAKRLIDLAAALALGALLAPAMLLTAIAVRLTSRGPVLFTQTRVGAWKRPFTIIKFRTMRVDAEAGGARWATANDPRVTPIGAFLRRSRLDELPQLWNVLLGDMSLVGPRPERPEFTSQLEAQIPWYDLRHLVKPGLTGWAQVCYPYGASVEDAVAKLEFEIYYLKHASLGFDLRILLRTVSIILGLKGR